MSVKDKVSFDLVTQKNVDLWLEGQYDEETKARIRDMLQEDPKQVVDAFYTNLTFGTGGLRGIMGIGTNRMNVYTVRAATQGLSNYILKQPKEANKNHAVFIGYDSRQHSRLFAEESAKVLAGNGIQVYLFKNIRPTPLVSFGCRYKNCLAAIMVTASHNPPEYNGYKVYWSDGAQIVPPQDQGIINEVVKITDPTMVKKVEALSHPLIHEIEEEVDQAYLKAITTLQSYPQVNQKEGSRLKIVYTSLHGTGITIVPQALKLWGFTNLTFVDKQVIPDGTFPTTHSPNPEEAAALKLGIERMQQTQSDLLIANDPDADRMGVAVNHQGQAVILNGNQICAICLEHILEALSKQNRLPEKAAFIKTIVTTELFQAICDTYKRPCFNVLTGFKYIAEKIREWENRSDGYQYIFGGEESYGYLLGTFSRDKDAVVCSALICEVALQAKLQEKTLVDKLYDLYRKYGIYQEKLLSINFGETKEGKEQMVLGMQRLRDSKLNAINGIPVMAIEDYEASTKYYLESGKTEHIYLPVSDVLVYWLGDGSKVMVRPSGTEPKVKIYCGVVEKNFSSIPQGIESSLKRCEALLLFMKQHLMQ
ncbi:phospho-sugar mutase [Candidatus Protochlamydia phocaeensis]|uniref:phospho-sugar mutase n=1 Tax=Candidatus Protochlamydia phocaeensis TaxID=1414722 RepID=UPI000A5A5081|nr:phospho-sugar mutase [Candidatus Protochlamydia phocaeensis]